MSLHHKVCHGSDGTSDLRRAETHTVMPPHATAYNTDAAPDAMRRIARALDAEVVATGLFALNRSTDAPAGFRESGVPEAGIGQAIEFVMQDHY